MPSSEVPSMQSFCGKLATTGAGTGAGISPAQSSGGGGGGGGLASKSAQASPLLLSVQVPGPWQAPPQHAKVEPFAACAVSVTLLPPCAVIEQEPGQSMPAGAEVT